jgi:hypothetical protein
MADNITTSAAFATANMKPAAAGGENIDATWGRNIADNTGFLYARSFPIMGLPMQDSVTFAPSWGDPRPVDGETARHMLYRTPGHNCLVGTFSVSGTHAASTASPDSYGTIIWGVHGDLGTYLNTSAYTQVNTDSHTFGSTFAFSLDLGSYVSPGSFCQLVVAYSGTQADFGGGAVLSRTYTAGTYKLRTTWV